MARLGADSFQSYQPIGSTAAISPTTASSGACADCGAARALAKATSQPSASSHPRFGSIRKVSEGLLAPSHTAAPRLTAAIIANPLVSNFGPPHRNSHRIIGTPSR